MKPQNLASHSTPALHAQGLASGATVHVSGVSKRFQRARLLTQALERVDLNIESGEFVAVVGPSGCGKSTMLKILAGLEEATSGTVRMEVNESDLEPGLALVFFNSTQSITTSAVLSNGKYTASLAGRITDRYFADFALRVGNTQ